MPTHHVYISGPITGNPSYEQDFQHASSRLAAAGHVPVNPAVLGTGGDHTWDWYMRESIVLLARNASAVALLPGWEESRGSRLEHAVAVGLGLPIGTIADWCGGDPASAFDYHRANTDDAFLTQIQYVSEGDA